MTEALEAPILSLRGISKSYGPVAAVRDIDLDVFRGQVLAICGDNGAGKSSLIKIISGAEAATGGTITLRGEEVRFRSPHDALTYGVATIYQDLALAMRLSIAQNVFLGAEITRPLLFPFLRKSRRSNQTPDPSRSAGESSSITSRKASPTRRTWIGSGTTSGTRI